MKGCLIVLVVIALVLGGVVVGVRACSLRGIGYDTPEAALKGFYKGLAKEIVNAEEYIDPEIRDTPEGRAILDLYDPTQFSGHFRLYGFRRASKIGSVTLETIDTVNQTQTSATLRVSGTVEAFSDWGTVLLEFGPYPIDDTVYLVKTQERWFVRNIEVHSAWLKK